MAVEKVVVGACVTLGAGAVAALKAGAWRILSLSGLGLAAGVLVVEAIKLDKRSRLGQENNSAATQTNEPLEAELRQVLDIAINRPRLLLAPRWQLKLRSLAQRHRSLPWQLVFAYRQMEAAVDMMTYDELYEVFGGNSPPPAVTREQVKKIPCKDFDTEYFEEDRRSDNVSCPICLEEYVKGEKLMVLPVCGHMFHSRCIGKWLRSRGDCPICRQWVSGHITAEQE